MAKRQQGPGGSAEIPRAKQGSIGIDLGGTNARAAVLDAGGRILSVCKRTLTDRTPERVADVLAEAALEALREAKLAKSALAAVGVGVAGQIRSGSGVVAVGPNLGWRDVPFAELLAARLPWPVVLMNDLSAAALGEQRAGAGENAQDLLLFFVGTGVGSGLILGGKLFEGSGGVAGEIGHIKVVQGGRRCGCGELGCLEAYCGGHNLSVRAAESIAAGRLSSLGERGAPLSVTAGAIEQAALAGDPLGQELWGDCARLLSVSLANAMTLLNPARVILGGGVLFACPELRRTLRTRALELTSRTAREGVQLVDASLGDDAGVVGSGLRALERIGPSASRTS